MIQLPPIPESIAKLPRDSRGYPVPWFVPWIDGKPEFLLASAPKIREAVRNKLCWVCGSSLPVADQTFVLGPRGAINRVNSEPPSHWQCAVFSAMACPFLNRERERRSHDHLPVESYDPVGHVAAHPGATILYQTPEYKLVGVGREELIELGEPTRVEWYFEGKPATRDQAMTAVDKARPDLMKYATAFGIRSAVKQAIRAIVETMPA